MAVGALLALALVGIAVLLVRRRLNRQRESMATDSGSGRDGEVR